MSSMIKTDIDKLSNFFLGFLRERPSSDGNFRALNKQIIKWRPNTTREEYHRAFLMALDEWLKRDGTCFDNDEDEPSEAAE